MGDTGGIVLLKRGNWFVYRVVHYILTKREYLLMQCCLRRDYVHQKSSTSSC